MRKVVLGVLVGTALSALGYGIIATGEAASSAPADPRMVEVIHPTEDGSYRTFLVPAKR